MFGILARVFEDISAIACLPFSVGFVGVLALIIGQHMPAKTRKGAEDAAKWSAFRQYLYNLDKYGSVEEAAQHFDDYLSFAIAFGIDRAWVRRFSHLQPHVLTWYYPTGMGAVMWQVRPFVPQVLVASTWRSRARRRAWGIGRYFRRDVARPGIHLRWSEQHAQLGFARHDQPPAANQRRQWSLEQRWA
jgi:hypothetical protein